MADTRALLVIADIGGYTRFMRLHRLSLAHAQENAFSLLEAVIDAEPRLELSAFEGDAAFLYVSEPKADDVSRSLAAIVATMHRAFHERQARMTALSVCPCDACNQIGQLTVKIVAHLGEVVEQTVRGQTTLAGLDVILVHRMLKNSVPVAEYLLMSEPVLELSGAPIGERATPIDEELEGLGTYRLFYAELAALAEPFVPASEPDPSWAAKAGNAASLIARAVPYSLGLKKAEVREEDPP
jgi:hypothetical protein